MEDKEALAVITEKMGYKEVIRFNEKSLHPQSICLLDFGSEAFIWIGKDAPILQVLQSYKRALRVLKIVNVKNERL